MASSIAEMDGWGAEEVKSSTEMVSSRYPSLLALSTVVQIRAFGLLLKEQAHLGETRDSKVL